MQVPTMCRHVYLTSSNPKSCNLPANHPKACLCLWPDVSFNSSAGWQHQWLDNGCEISPYWRSCPLSWTPDLQRPSFSCIPSVIWHSRSTSHGLYGIPYLGFVREGLQIGVVAIGDKAVSEKKETEFTGTRVCLPSSGP